MEVQSLERYQLANGSPAAKGPKDLIHSMIRKTMGPAIMNPPELPDDCLTAITQLENCAYMHLKHSIIYPDIRRVYERFLK